MYNLRQSYHPYGQLKFGQSDTAGMSLTIIYSCPDQRGEEIMQEIGIVKVYGSMGDIEHVTGSSNHGNTKKFEVECCVDLDVSEPW